jgi:anti-sigma factor RsiW
MTSHLVTYQLGTIADEERDGVEAHLVACRACLETYLALKRAADRAVHAGDVGADRPRPEVKSRLRAAVALEFPPPARHTRIAVLARRIPLYQSVALAALAAAIALAAPSVHHRVSRADASATGTPSIDTARTRAESLHIY